MRVAQIVLPGASEYERKSQRIDRQALLAEGHEVLPVAAAEIRAVAADVAHVYASGELPPSLFRRFPLPYVASHDLPPSRWRLGRPVPPSVVFSPLVEKGSTGRMQTLPEAVEEQFWDLSHRWHREKEERDSYIIGSFAREPLRNMVEQTLARVQRFRSDVFWSVFSHPPTAADLSGVDVWVDPAIEEDDLDGFVAEALVVGVPAVASRTAMNTRRLEKGRSGALVPTRDPNELTHAILTTLFKREVRESRTIAARQTASRFHARQRLRILLQTYGALVT